MPEYVFISIDDEVKHEPKEVKVSKNVPKLKTPPGKNQLRTTFVVVNLKLSTSNF